MDDVRDDGESDLPADGLLFCSTTVRLKECCACFDSISFCLSKGVGAPMGSVIIGTKRFIERPKLFRKMFGGGTRQVFNPISILIDHVTRSGQGIPT